ncbi:homoserine dehydrogenase [Rhizobium sp. BK049]|nr:homoserine dehydrogenase [Rhizobium sp. BK049]
MTIYNVSLIGFGGVNLAVAELIATKNEQWKRELGFALPTAD